MESEQTACSVHMSNDSPATPQLGNLPWAVCVPLATALTSLGANMVKLLKAWMKLDEQDNENTILCCLSTECRNLICDLT